MSENTGIPAPLHVLKAYATEKGVPICLHENKFFRMMFNGYFHYLDAVRFSRAVATVPQFENGDVLLVRLRRAPAIGYSLEFPRGGVDPNESTAEAAIRELSEETGYCVGMVQTQFVGKVAADTATINGLTDVYRVIIPSAVVQGGYDTDEIEQPVRVTREQFEQKIRSGEIVDGITLASWALACQR